MGINKGCNWCKKGVLEDHSLGGFCACSTSHRLAADIAKLMAALEVALSLIRSSVRPSVCMNGM